MLLRVRSNVGLWRVDALDDGTATVEDVLNGIAVSRPHVEYEVGLCSDPACQQPLSTTQTLAKQGLRHGSMVYCKVKPETCVSIAAPSPTAAAAAPSSNEATPTAGSSSSNMRRVIDKQGRIQLVPSDQVSQQEDRGFRKGMLPLRDMKMQWTLNDFMALDSQFTFKMQRQEAAICKQVSLDVPSITEFQSYLQKFQFQQKRFGFLYGTFLKDDSVETKDDSAMETTTNTNTIHDQDAASKSPFNKVRVEAIYEPPQQVDSETAEGFVPLDDPKEEVVDRIAELLGLTKVGWICSHEPREEGFVLSSAEVIMAAEYQLEAAEGINETPFVTVTVYPAKNGTVSVEAFQVSQQCMAMVAEEALEIGPDPKFCNVNETFTAIQEGKESKTVENNFFLTVVPIVQHTSETLISEFPKLNRSVDDRFPSHDEMKRQLQKSGTNGWTFGDRLADFNLLVYLSDFLEANDLDKICEAVKTRQEIGDGYKLILKSMAGMEGSY